MEAAQSPRMGRGLEGKREDFHARFILSVDGRGAKRPYPTGCPANGAFCPNDEKLLLIKDTPALELRINTQGISLRKTVEFS
jgi:hypothetical protein